MPTGPANPEAPRDTLVRAAALDAALETLGPPNVFSTEDPGAIGAGGLWIVEGDGGTAPPGTAVVRVRNDADDGWLPPALAYIDDEGRAKAFVAVGSFGFKASVVYPAADTTTFFDLVANPNSGEVALVIQEPSAGGNRTTLTFKADGDVELNTAPAGVFKVNGVTVP